MADPARLVSGDTVTAGQVPGPDDPDYWMWHAVVVDAIRYDVGGTPAPTEGSWEALVRLTREPRPFVRLDGFDLTYLDRLVAEQVARGASGELTRDGAAHASLDVLRRAGVPVPPRAPIDPDDET